MHVRPAVALREDVPSGRRLLTRRTPPRPAVPSPALLVAAGAGNLAVQRAIVRTGVVLGPEEVTAAVPTIQRLKGTVVMGKGDKFSVEDPDVGLLQIDAGDHKVAIGQEVEYEVVEVNKYLTKAVVTSVQERPAAKSVDADIKRENDARTSVVRGIFASGRVELVGNRGTRGQPPTGAFKHYGDRAAVARSDRDVRELIAKNVRSVVVTSVGPSTDTFKIPLGGNDSIVGDIHYASDKTRITKITVFHVGPSLA